MQPGFDSSQALHVICADHARMRPQTLAIQADDGALTYAELDACVRRFAAELHLVGVRRGDAVALCLEHSAAYVVALLAVLRLGAAFVPLDPAQPAARRAAMLARLGVKLQLVHAGLDDGTHVPALAVAGIQLPPDPAHAVDRPPVVDLTADDPCYLMHTSGSSGEPRAVVVTHGNVAGLISAVQPVFGFTPADRWLALHAPVFGFACQELWGALGTGGTLVIVPASERSDPAAWYARVQRHAVTVLHITPSGFRQWLQAGFIDAVDALRCLVFSGEALAAEDVAAWYAARADRTTRLFNCYALTETAGRVTLAEYTADAPARWGVLGPAAPDAELWLLDPDSAVPTVLGAAGATAMVGELAVAGPMVACGYALDAAATAARFIELATPVGRRRLFRTGDRVRCDAAGWLHAEGRLDSQLKLRGHRIEPGEIEAVLRRHPGIADAAVLADTRGPAPQLHAFVVARAGEVEFWPSLGEYQIYDALLYDFMSADAVRVAAYQRAFAALARDAVVLDMGTGKDALLARLCAAAGARKVYAVEVLPEAARAARALVAELGLAERIEVIEGDLATLELPQAVDLCTQGIVGNIGSSDGIVPLWNTARRHFSAGVKAVPARCRTFIAPAELNRTPTAPARFSPLAARYAQRIFAAGAPFDVRLCLRNFDATGLLAPAAEFEDLAFGPRELQADGSGEARFAVTRAGLFSGYVLWTRLDMLPGDAVDFLEHQQAWLPVWFPLPAEPVAVQPGDVIVAQWRVSTPAGQVFPDYAVSTELHGHGESRHWQYRSRHFETARGATPLHRELLDSLDAAAGTETEVSAWLATQLPEHLCPARISWLPRLPLSSSAKLDRAALQALLPQRSASAESVAAVAADSPFAHDIAALWARVLECDAVSPEADFFELGGDSILAVRLTTEVQRYLDDAVFLAALYDAPVLRDYIAWLETHHADAVTARQARTGPQPAADHAGADSAAGAATAAPLSWSQQSLWLLDRLYPGQTAANEQFLVRTRGVAWPELAAAWQALLAQHDVLRTRLRASGTAGDAEQVVDTPAKCRVMPLTAPLDLGSERAAAEHQLRRIAGEALQRPFDLVQDGLVRPQLLQVADELVLLVTAHHSVADGLCVELVRDELCARCNAEPLPRPPLQYADYARRQREQVSGDWLVRELDWWRAQLQGHRGTPVLPGRISGRVPAARCSVTLDATLSERVRHLAQSEHTSVFTTLLACWRAWLAACLDEPDLLLGSPVTQRTDAATAGMLGCLVNNTVFRNPLQPQASFRSALAAERQAVIAATGHGSVPFELVVAAVQPERSAGRHPLFQFLFQYEQRAPVRRDARGREFAVDVLPAARHSFWDLECAFTDHGPGTGFGLSLCVQPELFDVEAAWQWPAGFTAFLTALLRDPEQPLEALPLAAGSPVPAAPAPAWLSRHTLAARVAQQAQRTPDAIAVQSGSADLSYRALLEQAAAFACALQARGVITGSCVGLHLPRSADTVALLLAVNALGAVWLPLDPAYPAARLLQMLEEAQPSLVLSEQPHELPVRSVTPAALLAAIDGISAPALPDTWNDELCLLYTSGSTGRPKRARVAQAGAVNRCLWMLQAFDFAAADRFAQRTSLNFIDALWEIFGALLAGATVVLPPPATARDTDALAHWLAAGRITHLVLVPTLLRALLDGWSRGIVRPAHLHTLITSGEALQPELVEGVRSVLPECRVLNTYGSSELWDISCARVDGLLDAVASCVGLPLPNVQVEVRTAAGQVLPPGLPGMLWVSGVGVLPPLPADADPRYAVDALDPERWWFCTGDRAALDAQGRLHLHGRADRQIKLRGWRIEPGDIETAARAYPGVVAAAVVLQAPTPPASDGWLALYIVAAAGASVDVDALRAWLQQQLPLPLVPADIVTLDALPLTPSGKLDAARLPRVAAGTGAQVALTAPRTPLEARLAELWAELLDVPVVGVHENFFALRGNSLLAMRLTARICDEFGLDLPLQSLFEAPTVAALARCIETLQWTLADASAAPAGTGEREVMRL